MSEREVQRGEILEMVNSLLDDADHSLENFYFIVFNEEECSICGVGDPSKAIVAILSRMSEEEVGQFALAFLQGGREIE